MARWLVTLTGSGIAWTLHLSVSYFLVALGCPRQWPGLGVLLAGVTIACAALAATAGIGAYTARRRLRTPGAEIPAGEDTGGLLLGVGALLGALFALMIALGGLAAVALPPCLGT